MPAAVGERHWRQVAGVLGGSAVAQTLPLLATLLLARWVSPADFGQFAVWLAMAQLAAVAVTGRYEVALPMEPEGEARAVGMRFILRLLVWASPVLLVLGLGGAGLGAWPLALGALFAPAALGLAALQSWSCWAAADGRFALLSRLRIAQALLLSVTQLGLSWWWPGALALALGQLLGLGGALLLAWRALQVPPAPAVLEAEHSFRRRHRRFPLLALPADLLNSTAAQLPLLLIGARFGAEAAGQLALALRVLGAPVSLLAAAVLDVFKRRSASQWRELGHCRGAYLESLKGLLPGAMLMAIVLGLSLEPLFGLAFGPPWQAAAQMALWLLPLFALRFVASPLSYVLYVAGKQQLDLGWQATLLLASLLALGLPRGLDAALLAYSAAYSALYLVYLGLSWHLSAGSHRSPA